MIIARTRALCNRCPSASHPAELVRTGTRIEGVVHCPDGDIRHDVSSDADLFIALREKSATDITSAEPPRGLRNVLNYISITNACNLNCAVCGAGAKTGTAAAVFLSVDEIGRRAEQAKKAGGRILHLFGGEPTLHPDLLTIVEEISRLGFSSGVVTNGVRLGTDQALARELKARGLARICLQFDSFNEKTLETLGRNYLREKKDAIKNASEAGLSVGLNCTVTRLNLEEMGDLLTHGLAVGINVRNMTFASAAPVGRYTLAPQNLVDREQIIRQLLTVGEKHGFSLDDFLPLPAYLPWGIQNHPDCGAHLVFVRTPDGIQPLNRLIDMAAVYARMARSRMRRNYCSTHLAPAWFVLRAIRTGKWASCLRIASGLAFSRRRYSLVNVGISNYKGAAFLDEQRLARCSSAFHTSVGPVKGCLHFFRGQAFPGSKEYEESHNSC